MFKQIAMTASGIMVPEEYGGAGLGMTEMALFMEGTANHGIPLLMMVVGPTMSLAISPATGPNSTRKSFFQPPVVAIFSSVSRSPNQGPGPTP